MRTTYHNFALLFVKKILQKYSIISKIILINVKQGF